MGRCRQATPVATFAKVQEILAALPGPEAKKLRKKNAELRTRAIAGDIDLVEAIDSQREKLDPVVREILMTGLQRSRKAKQHAEQELKAVVGEKRDLQQQFDHHRLCSKKRKFEQVSGEVSGRWSSSSDLDGRLIPTVTLNDKPMLRPATFHILHDIAHGIVLHTRNELGKSNLEAVQRAVHVIMEVGLPDVRRDVAVMHASNHIRLYTVLSHYAKARLKSTVRYSTEMPLAHAYVYAKHYNVFAARHGYQGSSLERDIEEFSPDVARFTLHQVTGVTGVVSPRPIRSVRTARAYGCRSISSYLLVPRG
jgi:hypothetical protein